MTDCIFCKIVAGEIPSAKVYEDDKVYAFLDTSQATEGHTLLVPKVHVENLMEYDESLAADVFSRLPKISRAILAANPEAKGINVLNNNGEVAYQTVFHSHIHIIPRYSKEEGFAVSFANNQESYTQEAFQERAQRIAAEI
ncbi:HIT family protein [Suicoccus acidiformans]|uniref:HIT family protein n=1 Tax=Suicoccus acidiformans TaxID=2036206 RepID=A0A347WLP8_9LACT|nr:HIT family protein [Suicoccus acidiformans]AXY26005.1 HIT family protein [Suicoccus acidiformans]